MAIKPIEDKPSNQKDEPKKKRWYPNVKAGDLSQTAFRKVVGKRAVNILAAGDAGTGKTALGALFAPEPVRIINLDGRAENVVEEAQELGRDVELAYFGFTYYSPDPEDMMREARAYLEEIMFNYETALVSGKVKTLMIDGGTEFDTIAKYAYNGTLDKVKGDDAFGKDLEYIGSYWWRIFSLARKQRDCNIIVTCRESEIWKEEDNGNRKATGFFKSKINKAVTRAADFTLLMRLKSIFGRQVSEFEIEMISAKTNPSELGKVYNASNWKPFYDNPFVYVCVSNINNSVPDDWR